MSVLIKGMEMPKNCEECPCYYETEGIWRDECQVLRKKYDASKHKVRPDWCPLVEVPTPHGQLIDRDAFPYTRVEWEDIVDAPTVIEAEEANND